MNADRLDFNKQSPEAIPKMLAQLFAELENRFGKDKVKYDEDMDIFIEAIAGTFFGDDIVFLCLKAMEYHKLISITTSGIGSLSACLYEE